MKIKFGMRYLILPVIIALFLLIPENIVWGGQNFQTVPTIGPTNTPTRTAAVTSTQPISTQTSVGISTSTTVLISPMAATATSTTVLISPMATTATSTAEATKETISETSVPEKTESISATDDLSQLESTSVVVLPVVSNGDSTPAEQTRQDSITPIPAFVFPLVVVLFFVIIYLVTKLSLKKSFENNSTQNNK